MLPWVSGVPSTLACLIQNKASAKWEARQLYTCKGERQQFRLGFKSTSCLFSLPGALWDPDIPPAQNILFRGPYGEHGPQDYLTLCIIEYVTNKITLNLESGDRIIMA